MRHKNLLCFPNKNSCVFFCGLPKQTLNTLQNRQLRHTLPAYTLHFVQWKYCFCRLTLFLLRCTCFVPAFCTTTLKHIVKQAFDIYVACIFFVFCTVKILCFVNWLCFWYAVREKCLRFVKSNFLWCTTHCWTSTVCTNAVKQARNASNNFLHTVR